MNAEGVPTDDTTEAIKGLLMPLGGYKGSGLAMMVELLCGVLGGGAISVELGGWRAHERPASISHCFLAIDVTRFMPMDAFNNAVEKLLRFMKETPPGGRVRRSIGRWRTGMAGRGESFRPWHSYL